MHFAVYTVHSINAFVAFVYLLVFYFKLLSLLSSSLHSVSVYLSGVAPIVALTTTTATTKTRCVSSFLRCLSYARAHTHTTPMYLLIISCGCTNISRRTRNMDNVNCFIEITIICYNVVYLKSKHSIWRHIAHGEPMMMIVIRILHFTNYFQKETTRTTHHSACTHTLAHKWNGLTFQFRWAFQRHCDKLFMHFKYLTNIRSVHIQYMLYIRCMLCAFYDVADGKMWQWINRNQHMWNSFNSL